MKIPSESQALSQVQDRLAELLNVPVSPINVHAEPLFPKGAEVDAVIYAGPHKFALEWKRSSTASPVAMAVERVRHYAQLLGSDVIPLVAVPYMGEVGRRRCEEAGVSWLDLSGNARISASGLRIVIEGKPNIFKRPGRPASAFAPKGSRVARWLLMHANDPMTQRELAQATGLDEGYTSRIIAKLSEERLINKEEGGIRPRNPAILLDAWQEEYDFKKHDIIRGHIPARSGEELLRQMADALREKNVKYAATALGAAWLLTRFVAFRLTTMYLREPPSRSLLDVLSFREGPRGANVWLVVPNDEGVFHGASEHDGIVCVHPVQMYVDLKGHPERSKEAADQVRSWFLMEWGEKVDQAGHR